LLLQCEIPELDSHEYFDLLKNAMSLLSESQTDTEIKLNFEIRLLKLLGITPNLGICFQCGGELWQERSGRNPAPKFSVPYQLDASLGGVRCPRCCISSSYSTALHPGSLAFLHVRLNAKQSDSVFRPTQNNLEELDHALFVYFRHFFGRNLKSHALLKENSWKN